MSAEDFDLPYELEHSLRQVCEELGVPARQLDALRGLLATPPEQWPRCCGGACNPCVLDQISVVREIFARAMHR